MGRLTVANGGDTVIVLPRWVWGTVGCIGAVILAGSVTWASWVSVKLMELESRVVDREAVRDMITNMSPYSRDSGAIQAHLVLLDKANERHDADVRRLSESMARMEAKMDIFISRKMP